MSSIPLLALLASAAAAAAAAAPLHPVVWVPGLTSSNLTFSTTSSLASKLCGGSRNKAVLFPPDASDFNSTAAALCWFEGLTTVYDEASGRIVSTPGFDVDTVNFGPFNGSNLDIIKRPFEAMGYKEGVTLFSANFDWRFPSLGLDVWFARLKALIEQAFESNGQLKVDLLAVSYGPQVALGFLHRMEQSWKDKHIRWFIAESPVWGGSPVAAGAMAAGAAPGVPSEAFPVIHAEADRVHSMLWLLPGTNATRHTGGYGDDEPIIRTPSKVYTARNLTQVLKDQGLDMRARSVQALMNEADLNGFASPGVDTYVVYGYGFSQPQLYEFGGEFDHRNASDMPPLNVIYNSTIETGDTLVPERSSLRGAREWPAAQKAGGHKLWYKPFFKQQHAMCAIKNYPGVPTGPCFDEVADLLLKGTMPPHVQVLA